MFRRGDMPEPAPEALRGLGPAPGYSIRRFDSIPELNAYARANGVTQGDAFTQKMFMGAVIPGKKEVALLKRGLLRDDGLEDEIDRHEFGHTYGLQHVDGRGWVMPDGRRFNDLAVPDQQAYLAPILNPPAQAATFDWSKAFAKMAPPPTPVSPPAGLLALGQAKPATG